MLLFCGVLGNNLNQCLFISIFYRAFDAKSML